VHEIDEMVPLVEPVLDVTLVERKSGFYDLRAEAVKQPKLRVAAAVARDAFRDDQVVPTLLGPADEYVVYGRRNNWWWFLDIAWLVPREIAEPGLVREVINGWVDIYKAKKKRREEDAVIAEAEALAAERRRQERLSWARATLEPNSSGPRRAPIPRDIRYAVFERDGGSCVECGGNFDLQYDHVIPLALGGANTLGNLQLLCAPCNQRKGSTLG
jgi:hypothetical protein